jgi:predicted deacylase
MTLRTDRVELAAPDLAPFADGHAGVSHVWTFDSGVPGPHVLVNALMHGNEISGAIALVRLFDARVRPQRGRLTLAFANVAAFECFDPDDPRASRFVEEDMNRLWSAEALAGEPATVERRRARLLQPVFASADFLLDLHSMQTESPPLMLATARAKGRRLAAEIGMPAWVVADAGHASGTRLIDFGPFALADTARVAILLEAGQHWRAGTVEVAWAVTVRFLEVTGVMAPELARELAPEARPAAQRFVEVTHAVTVRSPAFRFEREHAGLEVVPTAGTVIARDGQEPIATPYDDCVLVMPSQRLRPGLTAVRLGRLVSAPG